MFASLRARGCPAAAAGDWDAASRYWRAALDLWRGEPLSVVSGVSWLWGESVRLVELHWQTATEWVDAELRLGRHAEVIAELRGFSARQPLRERLHEQLMIALFRSGQQAEALRGYQQIRKLIADELGVEPGPALREIHEAVLDGRDPGGPVSRSSQASSVRPGPHQLPADIAAFTGHAAQLGQMLSTLSPAPASGAPVLSVVTGPAGVGKTTFAIHAGHRLRGDYPDGQL
jgi:DNA-binding SARP family transcriptional activator